MRLGLVLRPPWADDAVLAEELGFDLVWLDEEAALHPLVVVASLAPRTAGIRVAASVDAGPNPVALAEEAAVADLALGGRLVLVVGSEDAEVLRETVELLFHAFAARPFAHDGPRWRSPARLPEHEHAEPRMRVTPPPAQLEPTIWLRGSAGPEVASAGGLAFVAGAGDPRAGWDALETRLGLAAHRVRRPALVPVEVGADGGFDVPSLVDALRREQAEWGMDVAVLELPSSLDHAPRARALRAIASEVRPRVQLDRLPAGLEQHWNDADPSRA
jgi:alkanesulfonate monooxygenase SsuD/methylene tetrahydromethanopterin reductase-like flavin-dependent oxidoreductase (luciferase family)